MYKREFENELGGVKAPVVRKSHVVPILESVSKRAPTMSNRLRELILAVFNHAVSRGILEVNLLVGLPKFGVENVGERFLSKEELRRYLEGVETLPIVEKVYFRLLLFLGMRAGELSRLQWSFLKEDMLAIPSSHQKNRKPLRIPLTPRLTEEFELLHSVTGRTKFMFPSPDNSKPRQAFYKFQTRLMTAMECEHFELRDIRRTVETHMRQIGCSGDVVALLLGHNTTGLRRHYDKGEYLPQKREVLRKWISWLNSLNNEAEQKVVSLY
jgi:integrase